MRFNNKNIILPEPYVQPGPPNDEIWYTSTDGNIVTPKYGSLPTIVSNTYVDGKGLIKCASDITHISEAYQNNTRIVSVVIPNSVTSIGERTFNNCSNLISVTIGNSVESIGIYAFAVSRSLTSITIPNSVTSIGDDAFSSCSGLTSVTIGNNLSNIGDYTFSQCSSLTSITIPNSVKSIGYRAFSGCSVLTSISYTGTIAQYKAITKGRFWNNSVPATVVHCTDGDTAI